MVPVILVSVLLASIVIAVVALRGPRDGIPVPDVRASIPTGSYKSRAWISPLLDAGFCVDYHYESHPRYGIAFGIAGPGSDTGFSTVADSYSILAENPTPGSRIPAGSTVEVIIVGTPLGGPMFDWNSVPLICPSNLRTIPPEA